MKVLLLKVDRFQQRNPAAGFVYAVVKKYGKDRGRSLAALIAHYGFLSLFPLLLLFYTVTSFVLPHYPGAQKALTQSVIREFPVIGPQLQDNAGHPLHGSIVALVFGLLGVAWGAFGVSRVLQETMDEVWEVPADAIPTFVTRMARGFMLFAVLGFGVVATSVVTALGAAPRWGPLGPLLAAIPAALVNIGVFFGIFRLLSPDEVERRALLPGAVLAGIGWQVLQTVGVNLVSHQLRHASQVYGVFGFTLALLSFIHLGALLTVFAAETNVVWARHLWPCSLLREEADNSSQASGSVVTAGA